MLWFTSDWHFNHNKEFVYAKRGYDSVYAMNEDIVKKHNERVAYDDVVYFLGDAMLNDVERALPYIKRLNGQFYAIIGNHDTEIKRSLLAELPNWHELGYAYVIKANGLRFYLSHYSSITASPNEDKKLKSRTICLYGHTHQLTNFYEDNPYIYHVGVDSHQCAPVNIEQIIEEILEKERNLQ